jgi:hypothetical protein
MKRTNLHIFGMIMLALAGGCSTSTTVNPSSTQVNYTQGTVYTYTSYKLDTQDNIILSSIDTITSTVSAVGQSSMGMTNVTILQNTHSSGLSPDVTYIAQVSGNFYHFDYGLESINKLPAVVGLLGDTINTGWVLQSELQAMAGTKWIAKDTTYAVTKPIAGNIALTINAAEVGDSSMTITGNPSTTAKHVSDTVNLEGLGSTLADTYVSPDYGVVFTYQHGATTQYGFVAGNKTTLVAIKKN